MALKLCPQGCCLRDCEFVYDCLSTNLMTGASPTFMEVEFFGLTPVGACGSCAPLMGAPFLLPHSVGGSCGNSWRDDAPDVCGFTTATIQVGIASVDGSWDSTVGPSFRPLAARITYAPFTVTTLQMPVIVETFGHLWRRLCSGDIIRVDGVASPTGACDPVGGHALIRLVK